jgi:hypothetical protein
MVMFQKKYETQERINYIKNKKISLNLSPSMKHDIEKQKMTYVKKTQIIFKHERIGLGKKSVTRLIRSYLRLVQ